MAIRKSPKERKLTKAEQLRKDNFEKVKSELEAEGYAAQDLTVSILYASIMTFVLTGPIIILLGILFFMKNPVGTWSFAEWGSWSSLALILALIVVHELIHGIFWSIFAKSHWSAISFGFMVQSLTPYCTCKEALKKEAYIIGTVMPTLLLGILPAMIAIIIGSWTMFYISAIMILAGGGDLLIILKLLRHKTDKKECIYLDHPYEAGLIVFMR